ncbi:hypothetical protein JTE90_012816 [Oedothorax gibbosus]|uniref:Cuticle protein n=1 Tax=Oedothorax gibbosus TaxID=931172 RepID=A0AAV6VYQ9_9ARAC|nr:hypothetical protein JTE90_012816 [Oedothorax gibbosus]
MLPLLLLCLVASSFAQQSTTTANSQIESEDDNNANTQAAAAAAAVYPSPQLRYNSYQPAAQQRRPTYTAPRVPETYSYQPYSFSYLAQGEDGSSSRQESSDASGRVVGSYTIAVEDGRRRVVDYVADHNGFRATIDTNEPGTDVQHPADVVFHSAAIDSRSNQGAVYRQPQPTYRPQTSYRQRPSMIYSQPASPMIYRADPYYNHGHGHDNHARHAGQSYAYYSDNNANYHWH